MHRLKRSWNYIHKVAKILDSASILHLSSDGNELFGENWGRKKKDEEEDSAAPTK